jgi:pilus assembly protein CpaB
MVILAVAGVAAAGAGYIAKNVMAPPPPVVISSGPAAPVVSMTEVLALTDDVPMGQPLTDKIAWEQWPSSGVADGFITRETDAEAAETYKNALARVSLYKGEPLRKSKLVGEGVSFLSAILPSGTRAVATQIAADTSAGGFVLPNDYVDIIMTRRMPNANGGGDSFVTETILKNIKVLAIDQAIQEDEEGKRVKVGQTATLELTPQQAEIITVAQQMADRLTMALRSISDTQEKNLQDADYLVGGRGKGTVRLIKSGEVSEVGARK